MADYESDEQTISVSDNALTSASTAVMDSKKRIKDLYDEACETWDKLLNNWTGEISNTYQLADITTRTMMDNNDVYLRDIAQLLNDYSQTTQKINQDANTQAKG